MVQQATAAINGPKGGKLFGVSATDGQWLQNNMADTISSSDLGQVMQGSLVNSVTATYAGGAMLWRIQDRNTLAIKAFGFGSKAGTVNPQGEAIAKPMQIVQSDIINVYPVAVNAGANSSEVLAWVHMSAGAEAFSVTTTADDSATAMTSIVNSDSLGTYFGQTLTGFDIQVEDGATLNSVTIIGSDGGTIWAGLGTVRDAGHYYLNMSEHGLQIPITKGMQIKVAVTTA